jgi:hypothetical protein
MRTTVANLKVEPTCIDSAKKLVNVSSTGTETHCQEYPNNHGQTMTAYM